MKPVLVKPSRWSSTRLDDEPRPRPRPERRHDEKLSTPTAVGSCVISCLKYPPNGTKVQLQQVVCRSSPDRGHHVDGLDDEAKVANWPSRRIPSSRKPKNSCKRALAVLWDVKPIPRYAENVEGGWWWTAGNDVRASFVFIANK